VLRQQLRSNPANASVLNQAMSAIDAIEAGKRVDVTRMHPELMPLFAPQMQGFDKLARLTPKAAHQIVKRFFVICITAWAQHGH
jgi:hypothetical protein